MSKVSSVEYPTYNASNLSINGKDIAKTSLVNGVLKTDYTMSDAQKALYDYAQNSLVSLVPQVNAFSPDTRNSLQSQVDAYSNQGQKMIESMYAPMLKNLQNNIASRFGNFDNSMFMDNLSNIESKRADAISSFAQDILAKKSELMNNELSNRYSYINLLNTLQNQPLMTALSYINSALGSSNSANSYNSNLYNSLYKQAAQNSSSSGDLASLLASALFSSGTSFL